MALSGLRSSRYASESPSKLLKLSCESLIREIQSVFLEEINLTIGKSHNKSHFCQLQPMRVPIQGIFLENVYRITYTDEIVR